MTLKLNVDKEAVGKTIINRIQNLPKGIVPFTSGLSDLHLRLVLACWLWPLAGQHRSSIP